MTPQDVLQAYVNDVARHLPRAKRADVALELLDLLRAELNDKAVALGQPSNESMALELVRAFGTPETVAARYRPADFEIIPAIRTRSFLKLAVAGVALQWLFTLPTALSEAPGRELVSLGQWWLTNGIGALWWPGFLVLTAALAAWIRHRWPAAHAKPWQPRREDRDEINRAGWAMAGIAAAAGIAAVVGAPWIAKHLLPPAASSIFNFDPAFVPLGGAAVVLMWTFTAVHSAIVFAEGRWRPLTRKLDLALNASWVALLFYLIYGPRIYTAPLTDEGAKGWLGVVLLLVLLDLGLKAYRHLQRPRTAATLSALQKQ